MLERQIPRFLGVVAVSAGLAGAYAASAANGAAGPIRFENVSAPSGLTFVLDQHATPDKNMV